MPEGVGFHSGFIGEYPWGVIFNLYEDSYLSRGGIGDKAPPFDVYPSCNSLTISKDYDAFQSGSINFLLPARQFFETQPLRWNGISGYMTLDSQLRFLDPSVAEPGPSTLLINASFLKEFLAVNHLALFWTVIGAKLVVWDDCATQLAYSRAHLLGPRGLRSSKPIISDR